MDIFGDSSKRTVCFPAPGPGRSDTIAPFEMAWSVSSMMAVSVKVALKAGSSNDGNILRASVASSCVTA